jgi:hypothetical protein
MIGAHTLPCFHLHQSVQARLAEALVQEAA